MSELLSLLSESLINALSTAVIFLAVFAACTLAVGSLRDDDQEADPDE